MSIIFIEPSEQPTATNWLSKIESIRNAAEFPELIICFVYFEI